LESERNDSPIHQRLQQQLEWIANGLPIKLERDENHIWLIADQVHQFARHPFLEALE